MTEPRDWDAEERDALDGYERELAELRKRHENDPSLDMLRAADADALPPELQARVTRHLEESAWSRAIVEGLRDTGAGDQLDRESEDRLLDRIVTSASKQAAREPSRRWQPAVLLGGLALAATLLIALVVPRSDPAATVPPDGSSAAIGVSGAIAARGSAAPPAPMQIAFEKPDVKLSPSALVWRGDAAANPFLKDLAPAFDAYRAGDYPRAVAEFDRLSKAYPDSVEVSFYQGVSRMLAGDEAGAIAPLEAASRHGNHTFADDIAWYLAVAEQRSGNAAARARFEALCRGNGAYSSQACDAVARIDSSSPPRP